MTTYNTRPLIYAYIDDVYGGNSGIKLSSIIMKLDGNIVDAEISSAEGDSLDAEVEYIPKEDLDLGLHEVSVYAKDNAGRSSEKNWTFDVDVLENLSCIVNSPKNKDYGKKRIKIDVSVNFPVRLEYIDYSELKPKWKKLCEKCDKYNRTRSFIEGWHNITIRAVNGFGRSKEENITFFIDSKIPRIHKTEPRKNNIINGSEFYIEYTEDNLQNIILSWNSNKTLNCSAGKNQECRTFVNLSAFDGNWIEYYFEISDDINSAESEKTRVFVDTIPPILIVNSPIDKGTYDRKIPFNITISEDVLLEYIDNSVASPRWRRLTSDNDEYGTTRNKTLIFKKGDHNTQIRATDKAGNSDTEIISFNVDY